MITKKIKCSNCGKLISDDEHLVWKCTSCNKAFKVSLLKLKKMYMQKSKPEYAGRMLLKCPTCGIGMDDGNEKIAYKCPVCENVITGDLKYFAEEKQVDYNTIICPECGKEISDKADECSYCGCPIEKEKEKVAALQQVEVAGVKVTKKTKNIIVMVAIILGLCVVGCGGYKIYFDKKSEREHVEAYNTYIDNLTFSQICMLAGGSDAESLCNLTLRVWGNSIYKEKDSETDRFTRKDNGKGVFYDDFDDALFNLYLDEDTSNTRKSIEENQKTVKQLIKDLQTVPEGLEKCYDTISDLYDAYNTLTELAVNPSGNYSGYSSNKATAVSEFMSLYEKLDNQIPNKVSAK